MGRRIERRWLLRHNLRRCLVLCLFAAWGGWGNGGPSDGSSSIALFAEAKTTSAKFRLSGLDTEYVLGSFAVSARKMGTLKVEFKSKEPYDQNKELYVRVFRDDKWSDYKTAASCTEKVPFSLRNEHVELRRAKGHYEGEVSMELNNHKGDRAHYYYFVVTDCSLEFYMHDESIPKMSYTVTTWSKYSAVEHVI